MSRLARETHCIGTGAAIYVCIQTVCEQPFGANSHETSPGVSLAVTTVYLPDIVATHALHRVDILALFVTRFTCQLPRAPNNLPACFDSSAVAPTGVVSPNGGHWPLVSIKVILAHIDRVDFFS